MNGIVQTSSPVSRPFMGSNITSQGCLEAQLGSEKYVLPQQNHVPRLLIHKRLLYRMLPLLSLTIELIVALN